MDKGREWNFDEYKEYCELLDTAKSEEGYNLLILNQRFIELEKFYQPLHNRSIVMNLYTKLKSERDAAVEALRFYAEVNTEKSFGSWDMRKKFVFDLIRKDDLEYIGEEYGPKKKRYIFGGKRARAVLAMIDKGEK